MPAARTIAPTRRALAELLAEARARTILLVTPLSNEEVIRRTDPSVSSVLSELERIVRFEEKWLLGSKGDWSVGSYDEWFDVMMEVRQRVLEHLEEVDLSGDRVSIGQRHRMVLEHEYRCGEAILETLQAAAGPYTPPPQRPLPRGRRLADPGFMARFPGGSVQIGEAEQSVWPEERPSHRVHLEPFWIDVTPVTNGDFLTFVAAGGYGAREVWSDEGRDWLLTSQAQGPQNWFWRDGAWWSRWLGREKPLDLTRPVSQVSFHEAEAFARFVGKRLPSEVEWEAAAGWDPEVPDRRRYPWGNLPPSPHVANLDQLAFEPAAVGAFPGNVSPVGCYGMIGDLWEWTSSVFLPYPGLAQESSSVFPERPFDREYRVLRGGSWATRPGAIRISVRRPALPQSRHLFSGFRCARDA
jgi:gamma-glutamyl hercynylcysteine S-oxide synthase